MGTKGTWKRDAQVSRREEAERWAGTYPPCPMCPNPDLDLTICRKWRPCEKHRQGVDTEAHPDAS